MKQRIEESLHRAASQLPRADFGKIAAAQVTPMESHDAVTRQAPARKKPIRLVASLAAACLVLMAAVGGWFWQFGTVDAIIDIDVNPAFEIRLNRAGAVLDINALNDEAAEVLEGRNYRGWDLDDAIETLFFALTRDGYLSADASAVLVSTAGRSTAASAELAAHVSDRIALAAGGAAPGLSIASHPFRADETLGERAGVLGVSQGKMQLILNMLAQGVPYSEQALAAMKTGELIRIALEYQVPGMHAHAYASGDAAPESPGGDPPPAASVPPASSAPPPVSRPPVSTAPAPADDDDDDDRDDDADDADDKPDDPDDNDDDDGDDDADERDDDDDNDDD